MRKFSKIVLFDGIDFSITLREVIASIFILGVMWLLGFLIASSIEKHVNDSQLMYRQAATLNSDIEFNHAVDTHIGHAFANGRFRSIDCVSNQYLNGEFLRIHHRYQKYTMHTRVVHYTTKVGKTRRHHTRVEHYWTWDTYNTLDEHAVAVNYCGRKFDYNQFSYSRVGYGTHIQSIGYHTRVVLDYWPREFNATIIANFTNGGIGSDVVLNPDTTIDQMREWYTTSHAVMWFWIGWSFLMAVILALFVMIENDWLED